MFREKPTSKISECVMYVDDKSLREDNELFLRDCTLAPVKNVSMSLSKSIRVADIRQSGIGNCYLLAALGSILEKNSNYLNQIMRIDEAGLVEVKLHDIENPEIVYVYKIEPTIVKHSEMNKHTNDAIFLLEKAYAIHRLMTERTCQTEQEKVIIDELLENNMDISQTCIALKNKGIKTVCGKPYSIKAIAEIINEHKLNYNGSLTGGLPTNAYVVLLGVKAERHVNDDRKNQYTFYTDVLIIDIIEAKSNGDIESFPQVLKEILADIFGTYNSPEAKNFVDVMDFTVFNNALAQLRKSSGDKRHVSKYKNLVSFFLGLDGLLDNTRRRLLDYLDLHVARVKGSGIYSNEQNKMFELIKKKLTEGNFVVLSMNEYIGRKIDSFKLFSDEPQSKGLAGEHAYHVVDCYDRDGIKYLLVRNPWGEYVRDYEVESKVVDERKVNVLKSVAKDQLASSKFPSWSFLKWNQQKKNDDKYKKDGYFELELSDLKRVNAVSFTDISTDHPRPTPARN